MNVRGKRGVILGVLNKRSIGARCATHLLTEGAEVICSYLPDPANDTRRKLMALNGVPGLQTSKMLPCNCQDDRSMAEFFDAVRQQFGTIDFLIHGLSSVPLSAPDTGLTELPRAAFAQAMDVGVYSLIQACQHARSLMPRGGSILTLSYLSADAVVPGYELLGLCKAALQAATRSLAVDLGPFGIRVNVVSAPPFPSTSALAHPRYTALAQAYDARTPGGQSPCIDQIIRAMTFLISPDSNAINGERLYIDGGFHHLTASPL